MVGILKSVSTTNILRLRSMVENSKFVATTNILFLRSIGCVYIYSIPWNYIYVAQLRRSLILVTTIITVFKACRRYAIFVILNPQKYLNRFCFSYGALTYSIYYPNFLFEIPRFFAMPNNELIKPVSSAFSADEAACCNFINAAETVRFLISFDEIP